MLGTLTGPGHKRYYKAPTICSEIRVDFGQNEIGPTGMGKPAYLPVFASLANALNKATGK
ncbi:hypothetical protein GBK04_14020 [Cytophagaceae bacterium SJW1-29]|uniref:Uncharacterized protein n=1 Tax=Salmonirosea aquatica TaxID=2654236 RepID=A0A7C9BFD8_9BACT|nr:hypothetical protein [Cytophagaceae bacterium SJW1-29]